MSRPGPQAANEAGLDEAALIERARAGDREAQGALVRRHLSAVFDLAYRILGDRDLAEDAAQDAMINAMNGIARFRGAASFRTWVLRITLNAARSQGRRRGRRREVTLKLASDVPAAEPDPADAAVASTEVARAREMLETLPTKQRMAVILRATQGLNYQEIGEILDCSEGAARVNYHLGIKRLREKLK
ncbi:MAG: RNA polymerase sigma factor [Gemmatimonadetes bacterium]|nr:RNA polymerase sigma factor [Gemmatimonadota bacterium]